MWCFRVRLAQADFAEFHQWLDDNCPGWSYLTHPQSDPTRVRARLEYHFPPMRPTIRVTTPPFLVLCDEGAVLMHLRWEVVQNEPYRTVHEFVHLIKFGEPNGRPV